MTDHLSFSRAASLRIRWIWWGSLLLFCVAGVTGALFRFKGAYGGVGALSPGNVRHAHSHLMYMGWATPALMGLIWALLPVGASGRYDRRFRWVVGATFASALLCYPLFLLYGYSAVQVGPVRMPAAAAASGLNILCWYAFVGLYAARTWGGTRTGPLRVWDVALAVLVVSTLGAWGVGVLHGLGVRDPVWTTAAIHFYLDLFSEGWFVLGLLGVAVARLDDADRRWTRPLGLVACGLPTSFLMGLPSAYLSGPAELAGRLGGGLVGLGVLTMVVPLARRARQTNLAWLWGLPLLALGAKGLGQFAGALGPGLWLSDHPDLRVLYLHLVLLGFVSTGLVAGARSVWRGPSVRSAAAFYGAVAIVLASLLALIWPGGRLALQAAAWAALLPVLGAVVLLVDRD